MFLSAPARGSGVVDRPQRVKVESQLDPYGSGIATGLLQLLQRRIDPRLRAVEIVRAAGIRKLLEPCCCWKGSCSRPRPHRRSAATSYLPQETHVETALKAPDPKYLRSARFSGPLAFAQIVRPPPSVTATTSDFAGQHRSSRILKSVCVGKNAAMMNMWVTLSFQTYGHPGSSVRTPSP